MHQENHIEPGEGTVRMCSLATQSYPKLWFRTLIVRFPMDLRKHLFLRFRNTGTGTIVRIIPAEGGWQWGSGAGTVAPVPLHACL